MNTRVLVVVLVAAAAATRVSAVRPQPGPQQAAEPCHFPRPPYTDYSRMARWLVHSLDWGVVSTTSRHLGGVAFGNPLSFADGPPCLPTGRLLFYLSPMDATAQDLAANSSASLALHELQLPGSCQGIDPEDPTCAKLVLSGSLEPVPDQGLREAEMLLFSRHPAMRDWPSGHQFRLYELDVAAVRLLDFYGGPRDLSPAEYFAAHLEPKATA